MGLVLSVIVVCVYVISAIRFIRMAILILRYKSILPSLDRDIISSSPFQPSFSIIINGSCYADIKEDIQRLLRLKYIKYEILIAVARDSDWENLLHDFSLSHSDDDKIYVSGEKKYKKIKIIPFDLTDGDWLEYASGFSSKKFILGIKEAYIYPNQELLSKCATVVMRDGEYNIHNIYGLYRYTHKMNFPAYIADLRNIINLFYSCSHTYFNNVFFLRSLRSERRRDYFLPEVLLEYRVDRGLKSYFKELRNSGTEFVTIVLSMVFYLSVCMLIFTVQDDGIFFYLIITVLVAYLTFTFLSLFATEVFIEKKIDMSRIVKFIPACLAEMIISLVLFPIIYIYNILSRQNKNNPFGSRE
ncbi:MAG: hypothetical protein LIO79_09165 [Rikenellaceae bacterium]|nr:hypothetical protein [Rikenellaceae bacterium]